jgi:O-antigen/teichoic acid export membrane protein
MYLQTVLRRILEGTRGRILADASARLWNAFLSFALLPVYLHFIGAESYGVLSVYATIQAVIALFDGSLAPTLTRELSRARSAVADWARARDLARTLELVYWGMAGIVGLALAVSVPYIAENWLNPSKLTTDEVRGALYVATLGLVVQWPSTIYSGGLVGLQRQKTLALIAVIGSALRAVLCILCLWLISPTVEVVFWVGVVLGFSQTVILRLLFWRTLPQATGRARFQGALLKEVWRFAFGVSVITLTSVLLLQADKVTLSRLLPLDKFGYYAISTAIASALFIMTGALFSVTFPKLSELAAGTDQAKLKSFYHLACQAVAAAVLPVSMVIGFFSEELLMLWTRDAAVAASGHWVLSVFIVGNVFNCLLSLPYTLQLAYGITRIAILANFVALVFSFPAIVVLYDWLGILSGPVTWGLANLWLLLVLSYTAHRRFLRGEGGRWLFRDVGLPVLVCLVIVATFHGLLPTYQSRWEVAVVLFGVWLSALVGALLVLSELRRHLISLVKGR